MTLLNERMRDPIHLGAMPKASAAGAVGNPACGDVVTIYLDIQGDCIQSASFESMGSAYQLATASVLCDCVIGQDVDGARARTADCVLEKLPDLPQRFQYLARLTVEALHKALDEWKHGNAKPASVGQEIDEAGGRAFVRRILGNGRKWSTLEVQAMCEAEAIVLPGSAASFLGGMRREGLINAEMSVARQAWLWSL